jgi:nucleoid DNA-binding protein
MLDLITSYLIQAKECNLPGIGSFKIITKPASVDVANKKMFPPADEIIFSERTDKISDDLITYIAHKKNIDSTASKEEIKSWCKSIKEKIASGEEISFNSIGSIQKDADGKVFFTRQQYLTFFEPVIAERVIHKDAEHAMLVGDKETTSSAMNLLLHEEVETKNSSWNIIALILLVIALLVIFLHFYNSPPGSVAIGNQNTFPVQQPTATYLLR